MTQLPMEINEFELAKLLQDDITSARVIEDYDGQARANFAKLLWGFAEEVVLEHIGGQSFFIVSSHSDAFEPGFTTNVDEVLDAVL